MSKSKDITKEGIADLKVDYGRLKCWFVSSKQSETFLFRSKSWFLYSFCLLELKPFLLTVCDILQGTRYPDPSTRTPIQSRIPCPWTRVWDPQRPWLSLVNTHPHTPHVWVFFNLFFFLSIFASHFFASCSRLTSTQIHSISLAFFPDFRLHVSLYYRESLVKEVTTTSPEGCRISSSPSPSSPSSPSSPCVEERPFGHPEPVLFPFPYPQSQRRGADKLPNVLERGVLLWLTPDGLYAKRLCQGRVYWQGPLAPYSDKPNKLEKEQTCKLLDTQHFLSGKKHLTPFIRARMCG